MKVFIGKITETYSRRVGIIAESKEEANKILTNLYAYGDIEELDYEDYDGEWNSSIEREADIDECDLDDVEIYDENGAVYNNEDLPGCCFDEENE